MPYFFFKGGSSATRTYTQQYNSNATRRNLATNLRRKTPDEMVIEKFPELKEDYETPVTKNEYKDLIRETQKTASPEVAQILQKELKSLNTASNSGIKK